MKRVNYWQEIAVEIIVLIVFLQPMFLLGILTGIGYIIAIIGAVRSGIIFKKHNTGRMIVVGTILTYASGKIFSAALGSENIISAIIIIIIAIMFWLRGYFWKQGNPI
jgi:hypothetical protein